MDYCSNKELLNVGLHISGVYPDCCEECRKNTKPLITKTDKPREGKYFKRLAPSFREESVLANNWKILQKMNVK